MLRAQDRQCVLPRYAVSTLPASPSRAPRPTPRAREVSVAIGGLLPALVVAAAAVLRLIPWLAQYPLHRDEALYGSWARLIASGADPLLLTSWVDKPPLVLYLLGGSIAAFGSSELALRLPGMVAGLATVPLLYAFAMRIHGKRVALLAALVFAACPFAILFAPTAFTDGWLTLWILAGAYAALAGRPFAAGLSLGLAVASKQQGLLGAPLVLALLLLPLVTGGRPSGGSWAPVRAVLYSVLGFALVFGPMTYWDSLRWSNRPSFWDRSLQTYGILSLAPIAQWPQRASAWTGQVGLLFGHPLTTTCMLALAAVAAGAGIRNGRSDRSNGSSTPHDAYGSERGGLDTQVGSRGRAIDLLLGLYIAGYLLIHLIFTFQIWDRYLLPLVPFVAILAARGMIITWQWRPSFILRGSAHPPFVVRASARSLDFVRRLAVFALIGALAWGVGLGASGRLPIGSDHGAYAGLNEVVATLRSQPPDAIIYHHWLGWHYGYYLFDAPQERRWWEDPSRLAELAAHTAREEPQRAQWQVLPSWEASAEPEIIRALSAREMQLFEARRIYRPDGSLSFVMYRLEPATHPLVNR